MMMSGMSHHFLRTRMNAHSSPIKLDLATSVSESGVRVDRGP
jgi:hypothetical protein